MEKIYFKKGCFITDKNSIYAFEMDKDDRFYQYITPYIATGKVESATKLPIDRIIIKDAEKTFFDNTCFTLQVRMMTETVTSNATVVESSHIVITGVTFDITNSISRKYTNGEWEISLGELSVPYQTNITVNKE